MWDAVDGRHRGGLAETAAEEECQGGITAFIVEKGSPGMTVGESLPKMGLRTSPLGILNFDNVFVPAAAVLGAFGSGAAIFSAAMDWERVLLMACHVGTMQRLLDRSIAYSRGRKQFGQTISKFQAVSHRLVDMKVRLEASRLLVYRAAANLDRVRTVSLTMRPWRSCSQASPISMSPWDASERTELQAI